MSDKSFTSGEKRGLIVLLIIMGAIVGWSIISKSWNQNSESLQPPGERMIMVHDSLVHLTDSTRLIKHSKKKVRTRKAKSKNVKPDGLKRDYLSEPVD